MRSFEEVMKLTRSTSGSAALEDNEARLLFDCLSQLSEGDRVLEIGCQFGRSSVLIAQVAQDRGLTSVHVDPFIDPKIAQSWITSMMHVNAKFTLLGMKSCEALKIIDHLGPFDLVYIDGDHEYEGVKNDLRIADEYVCPGGYLLAHDYARDSLPGVSKAIDEWMDTRRWEMVGHQYTMGAWRRIY